MVVAGLQGALVGSVRVSLVLKANTHHDFCAPQIALGYVAPCGRARLIIGVCHIRRRTFLLRGSTLGASILRDLGDLERRALNTSIRLRAKRYFPFISPSQVLGTRGTLIMDALRIHSGKIPSYIEDIFVRSSSRIAPRNDLW